MKKITTNLLCHLRRDDDWSRVVSKRQQRVLRPIAELEIVVEQIRLSHRNSHTFLRLIRMKLRHNLYF